MIHKSHSFQKRQQLLKIANLFLLSSLASIGYLIFQIEKPMKPLPIESILPKSESPRYTWQNPREKPDFFHFYPVDLRKKLNAYRKKAKPFSEKKDRIFLKFVKDDKFYEIACGEKYYITISHGKLAFSERRSDFSLEIKQIRENDLSITQEIAHHEEQKLISSFEMPIQIYESKDYLLQFPCNLLKQAKYLGKDEVMSYQGKKQYIIDVQGDIIKIEEGIPLHFDKKHWRSGVFQKERNLARIDRVSDEALSLEIWNESGEEYGILELKRECLPQRVIRASEILSDIHMRNSDQISCFVEKQKIFLKANDVIFKKNEKWQFLDHQKEEDAAEMYIILKEIQKMEHHREIRGYIIEKNRVNSHSFSLPISKGSFSPKKHVQFRGHK